jgi:hypothetical protein
MLKPLAVIGLIVIAFIPVIGLPISLIGFGVLIWKLVQGSPELKEEEAKEINMYDESTLQAYK